METPFVALPDPAMLFAHRADRFETCADGHRLGPYLRFLAGISRVQAELLPRLPAIEQIGPNVSARAAEHGMPPIDRAGLPDDPVLEATIGVFLDEAPLIAMPEIAAAALTRLRNDHRARRQHLSDALVDAVAAQAVADHIFVAAALQLHAVRLAAALSANGLRPVGIGICPACGGAPVSCVLVDRPGAHNVRYCVCATCATQWNAVRVTCVLCGGTAGIAYHHIEGFEEGITAETCDSCEGYVKLLDQTKHPALDPVADDVASLGLDLKLRDAGWRRGGVNPFLAGY